MKVIFRNEIHGVDAAGYVRTSQGAIEIALLGNMVAVNFPQNDDETFIVITEAEAVMLQVAEDRANA